MSKPHPRHLRPLKVYGYDGVEPIILAALISEDPLLLIGQAGTGKTFLLNSLSEAFNLEHRHYNASLITFDDLVGFPYPEADGKGIRYLETPSTIWGAETVLIDEINRCKPEHQNRLFSIICERRIQGIKAGKLRYRWAAMNPSAAESDEDIVETYSGCEPLDPALADRFAFIVRVPDWKSLDEKDQICVADPNGDGTISHDLTGLRDQVEKSKERFERLLQAPPPWVLPYCRILTGILWDSGFRISPRRVRQWARNILALLSLEYPLSDDALCELALNNALPQVACGKRVDASLLTAVHKASWLACCGKPEDRWLQEFHILDNPSLKLTKLLSDCPDANTGGIAVSEYLIRGDPDETTAFALALFPHALNHPEIKLTFEALHDLGKKAAPIFEVNELRTWRAEKPDEARRPSSEKWTSLHPEYGLLVAWLNELEQPIRRLCQPFALSLFAKKTPVHRIIDLVNFHIECLRILAQWEARTLPVSQAHLQVPQVLLHPPGKYTGPINTITPGSEKVRKLRARLAREARNASAKKKPKTHQPKE